MVILVIKDPSKGRGPKELLDQPFKIILPHFINRRSPSRGKREDGNQPCCQYHLCYLDIFIISLSVTSDAIFSLIPTCPSPLEYNSFKIGPNRKIVLKAHRPDLHCISTLYPERYMIESRASNTAKCKE